MTDATSATNYVLIDLENVQPKNLEILRKYPFRIYVFVGASQAKLGTKLAIAMQGLGSNGTYVEMSGSGRNALDFHIAFYIGELSAKDPDASFHIISRDKGFDPLVRHLTDRNRRIQRFGDLAEIPILRQSSSISDKAKIEIVVKNLEGRGQSRPRKVKTLANTISTLFTKKLEEAELLSLIDELKKQGYVSITDGKVSYTLSG
jgi:hypothetical protein